MRSRLGSQSPAPSTILGPLIVLLLAANLVLMVARSGDQGVALDQQDAARAFPLTRPEDSPAPSETAEDEQSRATTAPASRPSASESSDDATDLDTAASDGEADDTADGGTGSATPSAGPPSAAADDPEPADGNATGIAAGTCFDGTARALEEVLPVDCEVSHGSEIYVVFTAPAGAGAAYPGSEELMNRAAEICRGSAFEDYVGIPWSESRFFTAPLVPSEESWNEGARDLACYLYDLRGARSESARGSAA